MRTLSRLAVFALLLAAVSCSKDVPAPQLVYPASTFSAKVDGKSFTTSDIQGSLGVTSLVINAVSNAGTGKATSISIGINHLSGLSTYPIDTATTASYADVSTIYTADSGAVAITANNEVHITGSFAFSVRDAAGLRKSITAGSFDIYR